MVAYVSAPPKRDVPVGEQSRAGWQRPAQQALVRSPLQFIQLSRGLNELYNLLPNYRNILAPNLIERPIGGGGGGGGSLTGQTHLVPAVEFRRPTSPLILDEASSRLLNQQALLRAGPFELEQLQASSSDLHQRTKMASRHLGPELETSTGQSARGEPNAGLAQPVPAAAHHQVEGEEEAPPTADDQEDEPDEPTANANQEASEAPNGKAEHHSSRSVPDGEQGARNSSQRLHGEADASANGSAARAPEQPQFAGGKQKLAHEEGRPKEPAGQMEAQQNNRTANDQPDGAQGRPGSPGRQPAAAQLGPAAQEIPGQTNELLVGPFRSEAEAPATITLAGVVYQKSGASSALIRAKHLSSPERPTAAAGLKKAASSPQAEAERQTGPALSGQQQRHLQMLVASLWPAAPQRPAQGGLAALQQPAYLDPASDGAASLPATPFSFHQGGANQLGASSASSLASLALRSQQYPVLTPQVGAGGGGGAGSSSAQGELMLSSLNSKTATSKPASGNQHRDKEETLVLASGGHSSQLASSSLLDYAPALSLGRQPGSSGAGATTVWTIGKLGANLAAGGDESLVSANQHQLATLLLQQAAPVDNNGEPLASTGTSNHSSQLELAEQSQTSESKAHADKHHQPPIVIVQKDVKPVKYHLLRAYLKLRRLLRPFEATYVFPNEPGGGGGGVAAAFPRRRQLRLGRSRRG